jgi:hypothetical protein
MAKKKTWDNLNVSEADVDPASLILNEDNPYTHNAKEQEYIWNQLMSDVGFAGRIIVNKRNMHVVDGAFRVTMAIKHKIPTVPVQFIDADEKKEKKLLLHYRAVGEFAQIDRIKFRELKLSLSPIGDETDKLLEGLLDTKNVLEQLEENDYGFDEDDEDAKEEDGDEFGGSFLNELLEEADTVAEKNSKKNPTVFLKGEYLERFIQIIDELGVSIGTSRTVIVVISGE